MGAHQPHTELDASSSQEAVQAGVSTKCAESEQKTGDGGCVGLSGLICT